MSKGLILYLRGSLGAFSLTSVSGQALSQQLHSICNHLHQSTQQLDRVLHLTLSGTFREQQNVSLEVLFSLGEECSANTRVCTVFWLLGGRGQNFNLGQIYIYNRPLYCCLKETEYQLAAHP